MTDPAPMTLAAAGLGGHHQVTAPLRPGDDLVIDFTTTPKGTPASTTRVMKVTCPVGQTVRFEISCPTTATTTPTTTATPPAAPKLAVAPPPRPVSPRQPPLLLPPLLPPLYPPRPLPAAGQRPYAFAPYVDMLLWPTPDLSDTLMHARADALTLAFVVAHPQTGFPSWGGVQPLEFLTTAIQKAGKDRCIVAFGGANGLEPAQVIKDVDKLAEAYASVVDACDGVRTLEFDIEGAALTDGAAHARRHAALAQLRKRGRVFDVNLCLPVMPTGLTGDGVALLADAAKQGLHVHCINVMAMDYGMAVHDMGSAAISAVANTRAQATSVKLTVDGFGVVPMIGLNDTGEVFTLDHARQLAQFAKTQPWILSLGYWSCARDRQGKTGDALYAASRVVQVDWEFAHILSGH